MEKLTPFKLCCLQNFPFIENDIQALDNYGIMCILIKQVELLTGRVIKLDDYITNLDLQDEVNKKLDEMAKSGELQEIITQYLQVAGLLSFDNIDDLKNSDKLINGSFANTLGYHTINDGGNAIYKIRTITNDDVIDNMFLLKLKDENLVAELIYDSINVKKLGAYGDNIHDDTQIFNKIFNIENSNIFIPKGKYLITSTLKMKKNIQIKGTVNSIITTNNTSIDLLYVNRYCSIDNLKFELPKGYNANVISIGFKTLDISHNLYNNADIHINNIKFLFDLDINDLNNKTGNCFKITADSTESNIIYDGTGFWGIYIDNIFVKGACNSVINQYTSSADNWINSCYYNNFNIDSAPLYGFLGVKNVDNPDLNFYDGELIYFNNWSMQCGKSKNMFYFSGGRKYVYNAMPWDWIYAVDNTYKPFAILYRDLSSYSKLIFVDRQLYNQYDHSQIINKPDNINFYEYINLKYSNWENDNNTLARKYYIGKWKTITKNAVQNLLANQENEVNFEVDGTDNGNVGLLKSDNGIKIGDSISGILVNVKLNVNVEGNIYLRIYKNSEQISDKIFQNGALYISDTNLIDVTKNDIIKIKVYVENNGIITQYGEIYNYLKIMPLF